MKKHLAIISFFLSFNLLSEENLTSTEVPSNVEEIVNVQEVTGAEAPVAEINESTPKQNENGETFQFFKGQTTSIRNPFELRDPFKRELHRSRSGKKSRFGGIVEGTSFTNLPSISNVPLEKIKITGVLIGKERRAMAKIDGDDNNMYVLKEGMVLGADSAEIKAILPGGVVLVEKIRNVYDQDEYLETILTITQD